MVTRGKGNYADTIGGGLQWRPEGVWVDVLR